MKSQSKNLWRIVTKFCQLHLHFAFIVIPGLKNLSRTCSGGGGSLLNEKCRDTAAFSVYFCLIPQSAVA